MSPDELLEQLVAYGVPAHLHGGLIRYVHLRIPTGSFLRACLEGDWADAANRAADGATIAALPALERFIRQELPAACWGSPVTVQAWIEDGKRQLLARHCLTD